jgi:hypothetical protein
MRFFFMLLLVLAVAWAGLAAPVHAAPFRLTLVPDPSNPAEPEMGDSLAFVSSISSAAPDTLHGIVAWISLVRTDPGHEQPMDLEDWSALRAVAGARLEPGQRLESIWPMRLVQGGQYRVVVSVTVGGVDSVFTSPTVEFTVREKPMLESGRVMLVAALLPLILLLAIGFRYLWSRVP